MLPSLFLALGLVVAQSPTEIRPFDGAASGSSSVQHATDSGTPKSVPVSVYRISWPIDGAITAAGALAVAVPYSLSRKLIKPRCPCNPNEVNAFDRSAIGNHNNFLDVTSDVTVGLLWVLPLLGDVLDVGFSQALVEDMVVFAEVLAVNGALVTATKYLVQRPLPRTYAGDPSLLTSPGGYRSFYSGHTSNAMAALTFTAMTLRLRYGEKWWPWAVALFVGATVGIERVLAGRHFPTDVIAGGLAGGVVGTLVPLFHAKRPQGGGFTLLPTAEGVQVGWALDW